LEQPTKNREKKEMVGEVGFGLRRNNYEVDRSH